MLNMSVKVELTWLTGSEIVKHSVKYITNINLCMSYKILFRKRGLTLFSAGNIKYLLIRELLANNIKPFLEATSHS